MGKLGKDMQQRVNAADADPRAPLPKGFHRLKLTKVESGRSKNSGKNMWTWYFKSVEPVPGKEVREYAVFDAEWKFKQIFNAFGAPVDTDTDDLIGQTVIAEIDHQPDRQNPKRMRHVIESYPDQDVTKPTLFEEHDEEESPAEEKKAPAKKPAARSTKKAADEEAPF